MSAAALYCNIEDGKTLYQGPFLHPNPRFYKYSIRIFSRDSPHQGRAFFKHSVAIPIGRAVPLIEQLQARGIGMILYVTRQARGGSSSPFDPQSSRFRGQEMAPDWNDDPDPAWNGYK